MKKNTMMRIASFLLIAVLLSTSAISGTYAKYVTKGNGGDSARVAKFGVGVTVKGTMFAEEYDDAANDNDAVIGAGANVTVKSDNTGDIKELVAPGTQGDMVDISITGKPEVDVEVSYKATVNLEGWSANGTYYCPLVITIKKGADAQEYYLNECGSEEAAETLLTNIIDAYKTTYDAGTDLTTVDNYLDISWVWPFYISDENDVKDTALGDAAAANVENAATISIDVVTTVTQID